MSGLTLYPQRKRCQKCRRYFGGLVVGGQWCSYHCAGKDVPSDDPNDWPREHYRQAFGPKVRKAGYFSEHEAAVVARGGPAEVYRCGYCWLWHRASLRGERAKGDRGPATDRGTEDPRPRVPV